MFKELVCPKCEESLQKIINAMCEGYAVHEIICDGSGTPSNYRFLEVNSAFEQMTGLKRKDIVGKTVKEVYPDIDNFWIDTYGKVAMTGEPADFENYAGMLDKYFKVSVFTPQKGKFITMFTEITELKRTEEIMKKHKLLFECAQDAVLYVRDDGMIVDANESACKIYGYSYEELLNLSIHNIRHISMRPQFEQQMQKADESGIIFESHHVRKDESVFPVEVSAKGTIIGNEKVRIHIIRDITERKIVEERIAYLANHDSLTGIPNRVFLMKELDRAIQYACRGQYRLAVMLFDIDKFKLINDMHGHQVGDNVLKTVADRVKASIRNTDMVGRLGGDEFLIIVPMIKNNDDVQILVDRIFQSIREPIIAEETYLETNISVGISIYPGDAEDRESLIKAADISMYEAKKEHGCSYRFYGK